MGDFSNIINRLAVVRDYLVDAITDQGGTADTSMSFAELANQVYKIPTGMNEVRNAYQLFKENTTLTELPSSLDFRQFDSMYQMCYKCTSLTRVPQLETANVTNMMWAFYGYSALKEIDGDASEDGGIAFGVWLALLHNKENRECTFIHRCKILCYVRFSCSLHSVANLLKTMQHAVAKRFIYYKHNITLWNKQVICAEFVTSR